MSKEHTVHVTIKLDLQSKSDVDVAMIGKFLEEMDYGFEPNLFVNNLKIVDMDWIDTDIRKVNDNWNWESDKSKEVLLEGDKHDSSKNITKP